MLVPSDEQIKRLNAARFQLDIMGVPGIIVARTDAEAANLLDGCGDERDQPFVLGVTNRSCRPTRPATSRPCAASTPGVDEVNGHLLYALSEEEYATPTPGSSAAASPAIDEAAREHLAAGGPTAEATLDAVSATASSTPGRPRPASRRSARRSPRRWPSAPTRAPTCR